MSGTKCGTRTRLSHLRKQKINGGSQPTLATQYQSIRDDQAAASQQPRLALTLPSKEPDELGHPQSR